jgi:pyridoxamine 5'-phosphate oxidase
LHTHGVNIAAIRKDYQLAALDEQSVGDDPLLFFGKWLAEAEAAQIGEVNAMTVATVDAQGKPHARIVLLKGLDESGFVFFTNYQSAKGRQLAVHPFATMVFFWKELERQVRIDGRIEKLSDQENDAYFHSRPEGSRIGAWASPQSQLIANRNLLEENYAAFTQKFSGQSIPRPSHWGGYKLLPDHIEFWQGRSNRLHDRIVFDLQAGTDWLKQRLAP